MNQQRTFLKKDILKFSAFVIVNVLLYFASPSGTIDPWNLIYPRAIILTVLAVLGIQFASYVIMKLRRKSGLLALGALVGIVNSNVINGAMASISKQNPKVTDYAAATVVVGNLAMLARNAVLVGTLSFDAAVFVIPALLAMFFVGIISVRYTLTRANEEIGEIDMNIENPFAILTALQFAGVITLVTIAGFIVQQLFGNIGLYLTAFISVYAAGGPIIVSALMLVTEGHISAMTAATVIMIATISSLSNDAVIQYLCGARSLAISFVRITIPILAIGLVVLGFEWFVF